MITDTAAMLIRERLLAERQLEAERAARPEVPLPFGDGWLDDSPDKIGFHGTSVGLQRHTDAGQELCPPCQGWLDELIEAGFAERFDGKRERL